MRITTISSSIATAVSSVVGNGTVRNFLNLTDMRERIGDWLGLRQMRLALANDGIRYQLPMQPGKPGSKCHFRHCDIDQAVYAPSRLASARAERLHSLQTG